MSVIWSSGVSALLVFFFYVYGDTFQTFTVFHLEGGEACFVGLTENV